MTNLKTYGGLDPSLTGTGVVILTEDLEVLVEDRIVTKPKDEIEYRYAKILDHLNIVIESKPEIVYIEGLSFASKGNRLAQLAGLHYLIRTILLYANGINFEVIPPKTLKKYTSGNGNASKSEMVQAVNERYERNYKDKKSEYDLVDAYALARMGYNEWKENGG